MIVAGQKQKFFFGYLNSGSYLNVVITGSRL